MCYKSVISGHKCVICVLYVCYKWLYVCYKCGISGYKWL